MTKLLATIILLAYSVSPLMAEKKEVITGKFTCKVLGTSVTAIEDGKDIKYDFYTDGIRAGGTVIVDYENYTYENPDNSFMDLGVSSPDVKDFGRGTIERFRKPFVIELLGGGDERNLYTYKGSHFGKDSLFIKIQDLTAPYFHVALERYYKNDWQGTIVAGHYTETSITTIDCRHTTDRADVIVDKLKSIGY